MMGVWVSILLAIGFIGVYAWQIAEEARQLADALAATELVLAREQHLSQLDGLAAAAAHELGTPLSTISVIAKELERAIAPDAPHGDDVRLLREQATRCRDILGKLTELSSSGAAVRPHAAHRADRGGGGAASQFRRRHRHRDAGRRGAEPVADAQPGDPLRARQHRRERRRFRATSTSRSTPTGATTMSRSSISDDGPGFAPDILDRIGEPYVTSRRGRPTRRRRDRPASGSASSSPRLCWSDPVRPSPIKIAPAPERGATVAVRWRREDFERPSSSAAA